MGFGPPQQLLQIGQVPELARMWVFDGGKDALGSAIGEEGDREPGQFIPFGLRKVREPEGASQRP